MAVPRPVLIALLGLAALVAVFLATRNSQNESVTPPATPAKPAAPKSVPGAQNKASRPESRQAQPTKPEAKAAPKKPKSPADDVPPQVRKAAAALEQDKVVVFFFTKPGAADDTLSRLSVRKIEGMKGVEVFKADIADVGSYRPMLSQLEISQVPATAIVRPGKRAVLLQGYVDAGTLRQNVADALR
jgi:hypothetical protein